MTLVEFLHARITEDEALAHDVQVDARARFDHAEGEEIATSTLVTTDHVSVIYGPARVLAECEAKRCIVEHHRGEPYADEPEIYYCVVCHEALGGRGDIPCPTLRLLAMPYADHPDYREEWRP